MMLCSMFTIWNFKYTGHAEESFLCIPVCYHLLKKKSIYKHIHKNTLHGWTHSISASWLWFTWKIKASKWIIRALSGLLDSCPASLCLLWHEFRVSWVWLETYLSWDIICKKELTDRVSPIIWAKEELVWIFGEADFLTTKTIFYNSVPWDCYLGWELSPILFLNFY